MSIGLVDGLIGIFAIVFIAFLRGHLTRRGNELPYPPGPKGLPVIGNVYDTLTDLTPQQLYAKWGREFSSDIIHLKMLNTHMIIINNFKIATELFERRSALYSDRPIMPMLHDIVKLNWFSAMMRYGETWRSHRRVMRQNFHPKDTTDFERKQLKSTYECLSNLIKKPRDSFSHVRLMMASLLLSIAYGVDPKTVDHPWIIMAENTINAAATAATPGRFLVDTFPILKYVPEWMPGAGFKARAKAWNRMSTACAEEPFRFVKEQIKRGGEPSSVTASALRAMDEKKDNSADEEILKGVSAIVYAAGADTTISVINALILGLLLYPEVQEKAYAEIDRVVGKSRLPEFGDLESLPYVNAVVKEALRWRPAAPLAIPHRLINDDVYNGMVFPAGSVVVGNSWFMLTDENVWFEPAKFRPERFLTPAGELDPQVTKPEDIAFGFGRRLCPGRDLALSSVFILAASLIATLKITPIIDKNGQPILPNPEDEGTPGLVSGPAPFQCDFKPRSQRALELVNEAVAAHAAQAF